MISNRCTWGLGGSGGFTASTGFGGSTAFGGSGSFRGAGRGAVVLTGTTGGAGGLSPASNCSNRVGYTVTFSVSAPLRRTNWIVPWVLDNSNRCESSGLNNNVTTLTVCGFPWGSGSVAVPVVSTSTF